MGKKIASVFGLPIYATAGQMKNHRGRAAGILLAAGSGTRAGFPDNKAYLKVDGSPMISHSLRTLDRSPWIVKLVMVIRPEDRSVAERVVHDAGIITPCRLVRGGSSRHQSEYRGLGALAGDIDEKTINLVAIHDGARPALRPELLERLFQSAGRHGGSTPTLAVENPTYQTSDIGELQPVEAGRLHRAQTPQVFWAPQLWAAYRAARKAGFEGVDTAETVERFSDLQIKAIPGDPHNLKLTFPEDFEAVRVSGH